MTHQTERDDLIAALAAARAALIATTDGLTDEQAGARPTVSALCLGGLVKHVASMEENWLRFVVDGPSAMRYDLPDGVTWADAPWNRPGTVWSARRAVLHVISEIAQHAGHADLLRETLDGRKPA
jgi:uncharacterized damage-inducible protein DinB